MVGNGRATHPDLGLAGRVYHVQFEGRRAREGITMTTKESHRAAWKACETRVAKYIGGERVPITGRQRGDVPDIKHPWLSGIEVKYRMKLPDWIKDAMCQARASQKRPNDLPVVILCEKGEETGKAWILTPLSEFRDRWL